MRTFKTITQTIGRRPVLKALLATPVAIACGGEGAAAGTEVAAGAGAPGNVMTPPREPLIIVAEGDSLTASAGSWAHQWIERYQGRLSNLATPGDRLKVMLDDPVQFDAMFVPGAVATLWAGTNDLTAFGVTAEWLLDKTALWVTGRQAVGFRVVVFTMLPRLRWTTEQEAAHAEFNTTLIAAPPAGAKVVDVGPPPGALGDGIMYKPDGIHLTPEGQRWVLENRIAPTLLGI